MIVLHTGDMVLQNEHPIEQRNKNKGTEDFRFSKFSATLVEYYRSCRTAKGGRYPRQ